MRLCAALAIAMAFALPAYPQHGGTHGGFSGHGAPTHMGSMGHGGFAGHGAFSRYGGFSGHVSAPRYSGLYGLQRSSGFSPPGRFSMPGRLEHPMRNGVRFPYALSDGRYSYRPRYANGYSHRQRYRDRDRHDRHRHAYGGFYAGGYPGWYGYPYYSYPYVIDPGFYDWSDSDNGENQGSSNAPYNDSPEYPGPAAYPDSGTAPGSPPESGFAEDNSSGRIPRRQPFISSPSSASEAQEPLTVIFKDGRSPEQILNYIVSSTALTDLDQGHYQRIPLDQVDLDATEQTNRARGLIFQVPRTSGD